MFRVHRGGDQQPPFQPGEDYLVILGNREGVVAPTGVLGVGGLATQQSLPDEVWQSLAGNLPQQELPQTVLGR